MIDRLKWARLSLGRIIRLLAHPLPPFSHEKVVSFSQISQPSCESLVELTDGRGGGCGGGAKLFDRDKAWPSIKHLIFSG
jgi:hypothetical protein